MVDTVSRDTWEVNFTFMNSDVVFDLGSLKIPAIRRGILLLKNVVKLAGIISNLELLKLFTGYLGEVPLGRYTSEDILKDIRIGILRNP